MTRESHYWAKYGRQRVSRRRVLGTAAALGSSAVITAMCGGDDEQEEGRPPEGSSPGTNAPAPSTKEPKQGGTLTIRVASDPPNWSPLTASTYTAAFTNNIYSKLVRRKAGPGIDPAESVLEPDLAEAMPETPDETTYIFRLRAGVKFQDIAPVNGRELTAEDVKLALDTYRSDERSAMRSDYTSIESIDVTDTQTIRINLKQPFVPLLPLSAGHYGWRIFPRELLNGDDLKTTAIGTGPFMLDSYEPSNRAIYRRNPSYFKEGLPYFDSITLAVIPEDSSAISAFQSGQVDVIGQVDCTVADQLRRQNPDANWQETFSAFPGGYIAMNTTKPPFNDVRVRRALSMAFNRQAEIDALECGRGLPDQLIPVGAYKSVLQIEDLGEAAKYWEHNPSEAKQLLAAAGYEDGFNVSVHYTPQYGQLYMNSAERAISDFSEVGIKISPVTVQYNEWIGSLYRPPFNYEGILWGPTRYYGDIDPFIWYWLNPDPKEGISNQSQVNDESLVPLLEKQRTQLNEEERLQTIGEIQKIVADQQYYVGRTTGIAFTFWASWLEGWAAYLGYDLPQVETAWDSRI